MAFKFKTPGVYIEEKNAFSNSVVAVPTAVPAFIGYTEKAELANGKSAEGKPIKINSLSEYYSYFGGDIDTKFTLQETHEVDDLVKVGRKSYKLSPVEKTQAYLFNSIRLFYQNGGGPAYIISVGIYNDISKNGIEADKLTDSIDLLKSEQEPTMLLIPDALLLDMGEYYSIVCVAMLKHCGTDMRNRVALFDVYDGFKRFSAESPVIKNFRDNIGDNNLDFGAAYYPWVHTTVVEETELNYQNFANIADLQQLLKDELMLSIPGGEQQAIDKRKKFEDEIDKLGLFEEESQFDRTSIINKVHHTMQAVSGVYIELIKEICKQRNLLPVASAIAGVYTMVDNSRGVWKAPANVSLSSVIGPAINISNEDQDYLNDPKRLKYINSLRSFIGEGVLIWGAKTLDGNSRDFHSINNRRTLIFIEQSVKAAAKAYVFEPNDSNTWILLKGMLNNFLTNLWKQGALAGASPDEAFSVSVGLGATMTPVDILDGIMRVNVKVAIKRPKEYSKFTFDQKMQEK